MTNLRSLMCAAMTALTLGACSAAPPAAPVLSAAPKPISQEMLRLADMALEDGLNNEALQRYSRLLAMDPSNPQARLGLAEAMFALHDLASAREHFGELEANDAYRARGLQGKGLVMAQMVRREEANRLLTAAVELDPSLWRAWSALGGLHDQARRFDQATECYDKALALNPDSGAVRNNMGFSRMLQGKPEEAARLFMDALQHEPRMEAAQTNLRLALAWQGRYDDARSGLTKDKKATMLNNIGFVALSRGDLGEAEAMFAQAIEASPSYHARASANLVRVRAMKGS